MKRKPNLLANRTATVSYSRNGLSLEVANVPAADGALVAKALLDAVRGLVEAGYEELVLDGGSLHADHPQFVEEPDGDDVALPPTSGPRPKRIGFK